MLNLSKTEEEDDPEIEAEIKAEREILRYRKENKREVNFNECPVTCVNLLSRDCVTYGCQLGIPL